MLKIIALNVIQITINQSTIKHVINLIFNYAKNIVTQYALIVDNIMYPQIMVINVNLKFNIVIYLMVYYVLNVNQNIISQQID